MLAGSERGPVPSDSVVLKKVASSLGWEPGSPCCICQLKRSLGAVTPIDAVVSAATGVTICDRPKTSMTLTLRAHAYK